jgi:hypothetical protein
MMNFVLSTQDLARLTASYPCEHQVLTPGNLHPFQTQDEANKYFKI